MRKRSLLLSILTTLALAMICLFVLILAASKSHSKKSGFNRKNPITALVKNKSLELKGVHLLNICGILPDRYYFSTTNIHLILETDTNLNITNQIHINFNSQIESFSLDTVHFTTYFNNKELAIFLLNDKIVLKGGANGVIDNIFHINRYFNNSLPVSNSSVVIKGFDKERKNLLFSKVNLITDNYVEETSITDKVNDGGFATDGVLSFQKENGVLTYTNFYSNKIILFDTNMNSIAINKSLDTFSQYQASAIQLGSKEHPGGYSFDKPPEFINGWHSVYKSKLYLCSYIHGENENMAITSDNETIDVFELPGGQYLESLYIPLYANKKLINFQVTKNKLLAIYPGAALSYNLRN